ncbi:MAG: MFS transporter [Bryobacterales bacterium]|nr:MFS transporter [Bryobacterales bacterium]
MISLAAYGRLIRGNRNFRLLWGAQIISEIGDWFYTLSLYSLILELTGKAELVALAVVLQVLPQTLTAPFAGVVNDRLSRRQVMILSDLARAVIVLGMLFVRTPGMVWLVYPLLFLETLGWSFFEPGRQSVIPNIVGEKEMWTANTLAATTWSFNLAIGSTLGGAVAAALGRDAVFVINAVSFVGSALFLYRMKFAEPHLDTAPPLRLRDMGDFTPLREGFTYVVRDVRLLAMVLVKGGLGLLGANLVLLPVLGERVFPIALEGSEANRGAMLAMSLLMASRGVGALIGPFATAPWAGRNESRLRRGIVVAFFAAGCGYLLLSQAPTLPLAMAAIALSHGGGSTIWVFSTTLLMLKTEDRFRGRIFSAELAFHMLAISLASTVAGRIIDSGFPVRHAVMVTGLSLFLPALLWLWAQRLWRGRPQDEYTGG